MDISATLHTGLMIGIVRR